MLGSKKLFLGEGLAGLLFSIFILKSSLDICYVLYVSPAFSTHLLAPMTYDFELLRYISSYLWALVVAIFIHGSSRLLERLSLFIAVVFIHVPISVMYGFDVQIPVLPIIASTTAIVFTSLAMRIQISTNVIRPLMVRKEVVIYLCVLFTLYFVVWSYISGAASSISFDLTDIYYFRELTGSKLDSGLFGYFNLWTQKVFNIFLLVYGLYSRKYIFVVFSLAMQLYYFGVTHHRVHLFTPVLVFLIFSINSNKFQINRLYVGVGAACLVVLGITILLKDETLASLVLRRGFFVPASVTIQWVEYFDGQQKVYFADNLLAFIFPESRYVGENLPRMLGDYLRPGLAIAFNSGLVGAGYAQLGLVGVALYGFLLGVVINIGSAFVRAGVPVAFGAAILISPVRTAWGDSDLFTALLSHGILAGLFILWLCGSLKQERF